MESTNGTTPSNPRVMKSAVRLRTPIMAPPTSRYHLSCGSEFARRRKRWSPYSRKGRNFPAKSVSLETLSLRIEEQFTSLDDAFLVPNLETEPTNVGWEVDLKQIVIESENQKDSAVEECSALIVCARLMRAAWKKTRDALTEQVYRAENSELQAKSTMMQVFSMKSQLKDDICGMRERVKEINATSVLLDELEDEKCKLLAENDFLKSKIDCLTDERDCLNRSLVNVDQETKAQEERLEKLVNQALAYKEESAEMKQMKASLDNTIREMMANAEIGEDTLSSLKDTIRNAEVEVFEADRALKDWTQRISDAVLALKTVENQSKAIRSEITIAAEGGVVVQDELTELRDKVMTRNSAISKLNEKVETAAAQLTAMKSRIEMSERNVWQKIRSLPSTDSVVRSAF